METSYKQTTINGYKVTIFYHYNGTQLFINDRDGGVQIYAQKVSGDAMERAKVIIAANTTVESFEPVKTDRMLCVNERRDEFTDALTRGKNSRLEVYEDWDADAFVVVNMDNKAEYRVHLESRENQLFARCECPDFSYRRRICKHIGESLTHCLFSVAVKN